MDGEDKVAEYSVNKNYFAIMDTTFPTDAWGGINSLVVMDKNNRKLFGEISVTFTDMRQAISHAMVIPFEESDDYPDFQYRPGYENVGS